MAESPKSSISMLLCGDVGPNQTPSTPYFQYVLPTLASADLRFAQCERVYTERGEKQVHAHNPQNHRCPPEMASLYTECGFDVVSLAGNTAMDWGADALLDTIELFGSLGITTVGAGSNLVEARRPAIREIAGVRVGILAYCSVLRDGYAATEHSPGIAPMRAYTFYSLEGPQPGAMPGKVVTIPFDEDLQNMCEDVRALRSIVDVVVISLHWGVAFVPGLVPGYERTVAKAAAAAGADVVFGHHPHLPKAVEQIDKTTCFHSVGHFLMDFNLPPNLPETQLNMICKVTATSAGLDRVAFLPVQIDDGYRPSVLSNDDERFTALVDYVERASVGYPHSFTVDGDEVVVS